MTIEEMKRRKLERGYSYAQLSELSGVPLGTVQKIFSGDTEHPRYATLQALEQVLKDRDGGMALSDSAAFSYGSPRERKQGEYTVADYLAMPEEFRGELIDGVICDMAAPTFDHQKIAGEIYRQIANYIMDNGGECEAGMSPIDVQLDRDDKTIVQPDVLILCDREKLLKGRVFGAPDFVLEVVSLSTKRKDYFKKLMKYENAGVREYWILDPYKKQLVVFFFEADIYAQIHDMTEPVPVNIYGGKLRIRTDHILEWCGNMER
ncbi:MAG: helix-turn-helix domain-containing protein [Lachnospiraceae bacterium]|jgi:Uma2 family endonuclease|nr:helix-turn-helix domain-containing protein [Lachnospiraceae bacterium]MDE6921745.1 Uma2 family endonuclease [Lachnospiraceae bacterium]MDE6990238.1 Uma2 family endonuclease [Lachnospiraceae bacterium]